MSLCSVNHPPTSHPPTPGEHPSQALQVLFCLVSERPQLRGQWEEKGCLGANGGGEGGMGEWRGWVVEECKPVGASSELNEEVSQLCPRACMLFHSDCYFSGRTGTSQRTGPVPWLHTCIQEGGGEGGSPRQGCAIGKWAILGLSHIHMVTGEILLSAQF